VSTRTLVLALLVASSCYEMNVRPTQFASTQAADRCNAFLIEQLTQLGYRRVDRVSSTHTMYSKDLSVVYQTPLTVSPSGPMGGLIGLRVSRRDDEGCVVEMVPTTYDCTSTSPSQLYVPCELTPGASNDIQADITRIADAFRERYKM